MRGTRCPIAGTVTMDQILVDVGDLPVEIDDDVVLIGEQAGVVIDAADWAAWIDTIPYEIVTRLGGRLPRVYLGVNA